MSPGHVGPFSIERHIGDRTWKCGWKSKREPRYRLSPHLHAFLLVLVRIGSFRLDEQSCPAAIQARSVLDSGAPCCYTPRRISPKRPHHQQATQPKKCLLGVRCVITAVNTGRSHDTDRPGPAVKVTVSEEKFSTCDAASPSSICETETNPCRSRAAVGRLQRDKRDRREHSSIGNSSCWFCRIAKSRDC